MVSLHRSTVPGGAGGKRSWEQFALFCFFGGIAFLIDWGVFNASYHVSGWFLFSLTVSWVISMMFNFSANRLLTFSAREGSISDQLPKWLIVHGAAFLARSAMGKGILFVMGETVFTANVGFLCGQMISLPITFLGSSYWAFKKR
jgi:putative flippase GtrA